MKRYSNTITHESSARSVPIRLDVHYLRIPVKWSVEEIPASEIRPESSTTPRPGDAPYFREKFLGFEEGWGRTNVRGEKISARKNDAPDWRFALVPEVDQTAKIVELDPFELHKQFLKLDIDDQGKTLDFLNTIGAWNINTQTGEPSMRIERTIGHRHVSGFATTFSVGGLKRAQEHANSQMEWFEKDPKLLREEFRKRERDAGNPFVMPPLYFEWGEEPAAVIQAVSGHEMLGVTLQFALLRKFGVYVCENCMMRFPSKHKRRYCSDGCMHAQNQRNYRVRLKAKGNRWRKTV